MAEHVVLDLDTRQFLREAVLFKHLDRLLVDVDRGVVNRDLVQLTLG